MSEATNINEKKWTRRQIIKIGLLGAGGLTTTPVGKKVVSVLAEDYNGREPAPVRLRPEPERWSDHDLTVAWLGHASFLINFFGTKILLDPALEDRIGITPFGNLTVGPKRYQSAALTADEVGLVDLLLVSHAHTDHFDYPTLRRLQSTKTIAVTAKNTTRLWQGMNFKSVVQMHWQDTQELAGVQVRAIEGQHWGARMPWYKDMEANSLLLSKNGVNIFFGGDTGYTPKIKEQLTDIPIDLAIVGIGAYKPKSFEKRHATPEQAWQIAEEIGAKWVIPMHWGAFRLGQEPMEEPIKRFREAAAEKHEKIAIQEVGATWGMPKS